MKWFKHYTDSLDDPFIVALMDKFQAQGYVAYFGLIEIVSKENGHKLTGELEVDPTYLKRKLRISVAKLQQIFDFCHTKGKLSFDFSEDIWKFKFYKILEIKDNHTTNLQATGKKVSLEEEKEKEGKSKKKKKTVRDIYGEYKHVLLSLPQYEKLIKDFGGIKTSELIKILDEAIEMKGYKYKNFNLVLRGWVLEKYEKEKGKKGIPGVGDDKIDEQNFEEGNF